MIDRDFNLGVDIKTKIENLNYKNIKTQFFDSGGRSGFKDNRKMYSKVVHTIIVVYDVTNIKSFNIPKILSYI